MKVYAYIIALVFVTSASLSFGQTIEEKKLAVAKNYMLNNKLKSYTITIDFGGEISSSTWDDVKNKLIGNERVYLMDLNQSSTAATVKYSEGEHLGLIIKESLEKIVGNAIVISNPSMDSLNSLEQKN